jgi:hypothetical protein
MHRLVRETDGSVVPYVGAQNLPFPVPLKANGGHWQFDSDSGSQEILPRVIGENESAAIKVCQTISKANPINKDDESIIKFAQETCYFPRFGCQRRAAITFEPREATAMTLLPSPTLRSIAHRE